MRHQKIANPSEEHHDGNGSLRRAALLVACGMIARGRRLAQVSNDVVKLGVTNDQASIYSAAGGFGVVIAARMAAEDSGGSVLGKKIEVVFADNQNKPDIGVSIVRRWIDTENVDAIVDGGYSAVGMAIQPVTRETNKLFLISGSGTHALTNQNCSATGFQWSWDTYGLAAGTATELMKQKLDTWFFITADYTFGHLLEAAGDRGGDRSTAARCSARCACRSTPRTSRPSCCRRRPPAPRWSRSRPRAATPPTR